MADPTNHNASQKNYIRSHVPTWDTVVRVLASFIIGAFSASFLLGGKSRDVTDLLTFKGEAVAQFKAINEKFEQLDRNGTNKSRWTDETQSAAIIANGASVLDLGRKVDANGAMIAVIQSKIERMEGGLKDIENRTRK